MYNNYVKTAIETAPAAECNAHKIGDYTRRSTRTLFPFILGIKTRPEDRGNTVAWWSVPIQNTRPAYQGSTAWRLSFAGCYR